MFNYCFNLQSHDRKGVVTKIEYRLSNSLMNQFLSAVISTKAETYLLINQFTSSPINSLHRARKNNLFMQNEPNLKQLYEFITAYTTSTYKIYVFKYTLKNEPKRTQNEPNFSSKLASFSPKLALFQKKIFTFAKKLCIRKSDCPSKPEGRRRVKSAVKHSFILGVLRVRLWRDPSARRPASTNRGEPRGLRLTFWRELCGEFSFSSLKSCNLLIKNKLTHCVNLLKSTVFSIEG
jgi:hypothetical protein